MNTEEIFLKLNDHDHEIGSLKHRVAECENQQAVMSALTRSVDRLAVSVENMANEQKELKSDVKALKEIPSSRYEHYRRLIIGCVITGILGAIIGAVIALIIK